jgi:hypothetical protein
LSGSYTSRKKTLVVATQAACTCTCLHCGNRMLSVASRPPPAAFNRYNEELSNVFDVSGPLYANDVVAPAVAPSAELPATNNDDDDDDDDEAFFAVLDDLCCLS